MIALTRRYQFCASHRLDSPRLSREANREVYGKCNHPYGHGHNYELEVTVRGPIDRETGRIVDLNELDALIKSRVVDLLDHRNLNQEISFFQDLVPTTENLCVIVGEQLRQAWPSAFSGPHPALERVRIYETARNIFEI